MCQNLPVVDICIKVKFCSHILKKKEVGNVDHENGMPRGQGNRSFVHNLDPKPPLIVPQ